MNSAKGDPQKVIKNGLRQIFHRAWFLQPVLRQLDRMEALIMATQADVDALTAQVEQVNVRLNQGVNELKDEIDRLGESNPEVDLSGLTSALAPLETLASDLENDNIPAAPTDPNNQPHPDQTLPGDL